MSETVDRDLSTKFVGLWWSRSRLRIVTFSVDPTKDSAMGDEVVFDIPFSLVLPPWTLWDPFIVLEFVPIAEIEL